MPKSFPKQDHDAAREDSQTPIITLKLRFQANAINRIYDYFDDTFLWPNKDGSFTLEASLPEGEWFYSYILSFGSFPLYVLESIIYLLDGIVKKLLSFYQYLPQMG